MKNFVNAWELPHYYHAACGLYNPKTGNRIGGAQLHAEYENELYAAIEVEDWDNNPEIIEIHCEEVRNGEVVREWTLIPTRLEVV